MKEKKEVRYSYFLFFNWMNKAASDDAALLY